MSDGAGQVNLHGPALEADSLYEAAFTVQGFDGWFYKYNPCNGFTVAGFYDLAIFQSPDTYGSWGHDLGVQSNTSFNYTEASGLTIHYTAMDTLRSSRVLLVCVPGANQHNLEFIGELTVTEYDFVFTSPCACPGACDNNGIIGMQTPPPGDGETCNFVDSCTCEMSDGSGQVNLHGLALDGLFLNEAAFTVSSDGWNFKYNPCNGFSFSSFSDLAVLQTDHLGGWGYDLGVQSTVNFDYTKTSGVSIHYTAADALRKSRILLVCQPNLNEHKLEYIGELVMTEYDFLLSTPCACPGFCDNDGIIDPLPTPPPDTGGETSCTFIDSCTCEMSDGSGQVNLHGPALDGSSLYNSAFTLFGNDGWYYKYNPCNGFILGGYYDLAIFQSSDIYGYWGYDLGVQGGSYFNYTEASGLSIHYTAADGLRSSRMLLLCQPGSNEHSLEFVGELVVTEYDFIFASPCACPGACDYNGVIEDQTAPPVTSPSGDGSYCTLVDSCTCEMSDGSGKINLNSLALEGLYLYDAAFSVVGSDGWIYKYNPCNGFSFSVYSDLAIAQTDQFGTWGYDIGVQSTVSFNYDSTSGLAIHYTAADGVRSSRVLLVCEPSVNSNALIFVGELIILEYEFILTSPCACPGKCNNDGLIEPLPTLPPGGNDGKSCNYMDSCTCEMSDGTGTVNLHALSLGDYYLYDSAFTVYGADGYYYKYNPCNAFYFSSYYDTAVAQSFDFYGSYGTELGTQYSAHFSYTDDSGLVIHYDSSYLQQSSRILLICEPSTNEHKFQFIGQLSSSEYEFMLTTPCACPGGCDDDGLIEAPPSGTYCSKVDSCTCDMTDGSGSINLKSLALEGDSLTEAAFTYDGLDGWLYKYNPCNGFDMLYYYDMALAQVNFHGTSGHELGSQSSADFKYSASNDISIHYDSTDRVRTSRVLLVCDPYAKDAQFEYIGELTSLEYDFLLKSACACVGGCNDYGLVNPIATESPPSENNGVNFPDNINVNVNQEDGSDYFWTDVVGATVALIFHDLILVLVIAAVVLIIKHTMWCGRGAPDAATAKMHYDRLHGVVTGGGQSEA